MMKLWASATGTCSRPYPGRLPAARRAVRSHPWRRPQRICADWPAAGGGLPAPRGGRPARYELACDYVVDLLKSTSRSARPTAHRHRCQGVRHDHDRDLRGRPLRGRHRQGRGRRHLAGSRAGTTSPPTTAPPPSRRPRGPARSTGSPAGKPADQPCHPHGCRHPGQPPPQPRAGAYYDRKIAEGKTGKEALRSLKRRISDVIYAALVADAHLRTPGGPGRANGERL